MAEPAQQKFALPTLTAMVVGSMVGAGIFSLPQTFGRVTGGLGALIAWAAIAGGGMLMLAGIMLVTVFVFVGIEGASLYSRYACKRSAVGLATLLGFLGVLCLPVLVTMLTSSMILLPYLLTAAYALKPALSGESYERDAKGRSGDLVRAALARLYI